MAIKAPAWCSHAIPTLNGWEDPDTGELYVSSGFDQDQIDEFFNVKASGMQVLKEVPEPEVEPADSTTSPPESDLPSPEVM